MKILDKTKKKVKKLSSIDKNVTVFITKNSSLNGKKNHRWSLRIIGFFFCCYLCTNSNRNIMHVAINRTTLMDIKNCININMKERGGGSGPQLRFRELWEGWKMREVDETDITT